MLRSVAILFLIALSVPLYAQAEVTPAMKTLRQWNLTPDYTEEVAIPFDTVFSLFHRYRISDRYSPLNAYPGNYGLPFYQISFFDRISDPDKFLSAYYYPFMFLPDKAVFMDTQIPFTEMVWSYGAPRETSEQTFRVRHSQNVNRHLNFGLIYDIIYSLGQYNYQRAEDKTFTFYSSYTGPRYKLYFSSGINNLLSFENGGVISADQLNDFETRDVPVNLGGLNMAKSSLRNRNVLLVQRYTIGKQAAVADSSLSADKEFSGLRGTFSHILTWETNKRTYSDDYPASGLYDTVFIDNEATFDSLYSRHLKNTVRFDFTTDPDRKLRLGGGVGIRNELFRFSQIVPTHDKGLSDTLTWNRSNNVVLGRLFNNIGDKFRWVANGELFLTGYRAGDFSLDGEIVKAFDWIKGPASWKISGSMMSRQPSFWYENWGSNHFEWHNSLSKEFRIDLGTSFDYPARKALMKVNYALIDNYTDFDTHARPSQHGGGLSVASLMARKDFRAWKFHLTTDVLLQRSSNRDILDLPLASVRATAFIEHLFRFEETNGKLYTQIGADLSYHTAYYAYAYTPATGRFHRQDQVRTGNYPFLNVFLNLKLQRTRFFIMMDHLNAGMMGFDYFMIPSYPLNVRMLRYGLAWTFYN